MELLTYRSHIVVTLYFFPMLLRGERRCLPTDSYIHLKFDFHSSLFSGKCYFIDKEKNCAGESAEAKIIITAFSLIKDNIAPGMPFILYNNGILQIGEGIIKEIIELDY